VCLPEQLIYNGHYTSIGRGVSYRCGVCGQWWEKINDQYTEDSQLVRSADH
jgi:hypothetical protein